MNITRNQLESFGGLNALYVSRLSQVESLFDFRKTEQSITLANVIANFSSIGFLRQTASLTTEQVHSKNGIATNVSIESKLVKLRDEVIQFEREFNNKKVVLIATDHNGQSYLYGSTEEFLRMFTNYNTGKAIADTNSIAVRITGTLTRAFSLTIT